MLKLALAAALVMSMYALFWLGQARGATDMLTHAREEQQTIVADYEAALAWAQAEYDTLHIESSDRITELEEMLIIAQDTTEYWRQQADQAKAEASRWRSQASFWSGASY